MADIRWAGYPSAVVYESKALKKPVQHLLWGDWLTVSKVESDIASVRARGVDGFMRVADIQKERLLEIVFVDIGQGDGALISTPKDKHILIDAGQGDNMRRFLRWRFNDFKRAFPFEAIIVSHSDLDHYGGFDDLFDDNIKVGTLYHNGIMERTGNDPLGPRSGSPSMLTDLIKTRADLDKFLSKKASWNRKRYPTMLKKGLDNGVLGDVRALSVADKFLPGYGPSDPLCIEILGPVTEPTGSGTGLRWLGDAGKTKNGHSIVMRLRYGNVRVLLGGDLNIPSENLLLAHHTQLEVPPRSAAEHEVMVAAAREVFAVDIAKACHHGSSDVSLDFLAALNPLATVVSSGDDEPHAHPRADTLGAIGACSRGPRPLIFSTELSRSAREVIKHPNVMRERLRTLPGLIHAAADNAKLKAKLEKEQDELLGQLTRSVAVYGAINMRTDGKRVVIAYKIEAPSTPDRKWDIYTLTPDATGVLRYESKH